MEEGCITGIDFLDIPEGFLDSYIGLVACVLQLWKRFKGNKSPPENLGASKEYNADMVPKFMMANGTLVRVLIHTNVTKYLNFKAVDNSFVYNTGKVYKVPATDVEALKSPLIGLLEKHRARKFFIYVQDYVDEDPKTHEGMDLNKIIARGLIEKYGLEDNTIDFIGHALALFNDHKYLDHPAMDFVKRMKVENYTCYSGLTDFVPSYIDSIGYAFGKTFNALL